MPHFTLVTADGESLGGVELAGQNWDVGDVIYPGPGDRLRVLDVLDADDPEDDG